MPQFSYKARRRTGEVVEGILDVTDRSAALIQIERLGLFPVAVDAAKGAAMVLGERGGARTKAEWQNLLPPALRAALTQKRKPKLQELATFTQQLANLLHSGMPLTVALNSMTHLESKGISAEVSKELKQDVMEGRSLSDSMAKQRIYTSTWFGPGNPAARWWRCCAGWPITSSASRRCSPNSRPRWFIPRSWRWWEFASFSFS